MEHRSIIIQSIQKIFDQITSNPNAVNDLKQIWAFVASRSGIISSNAIIKLVALVKLNIIPWSQALNGLIDALPTVPGVTLDNIAIGITDILIYQVENEIDSLEYKCPFSVKAVHGKKIHPFILAITMKSRESFYTLLLQLERIFDTSRIKLTTGLDSTQKLCKYMQNSLEMMKPFFNFILFGCPQELKENQKSWSPSLINSISNIIYRDIGDEFYSKFREDVLYYLLSVVRRKSLETFSCSQRIQYDAVSIEIYLMLQSIVRALEFSFVRENLSTTFLQDFSTTLGIQFLSLACDAHKSNLSAVQYISMFSHLFELHQNYPEIISKPNYSLSWSALSFLLLDSQSYEVQLMILEIMQKLIENTNKQEVSSAALVNLAILPIFQVISELPRGILMDNATAILFMIQKFNTIHGVSNESSFKEVKSQQSTFNFSCQFK